MAARALHRPAFNALTGSSVPSKRPRHLGPWHEYRACHAGSRSSVSTVIRRGNTSEVFYLYISFGFWLTFKHRLFLGYHFQYMALSWLVDHSLFSVFIFCCLIQIVVSRSPNKSSLILISISHILLIHICFNNQQDVKSVVHIALASFLYHGRNTMWAKAFPFPPFKQLSFPHPSPFQPLETANCKLPSKIPSHDTDHPDCKSYIAGRELCSAGCSTESRKWTDWNSCSEHHESSIRCYLDGKYYYFSERRHLDICGISSFGVLWLIASRFLGLKRFGANVSAQSS